MRTSKTALRKHFLSVRERMAASECEFASARITSSLLSSKLFCHASRLLLYASFRKEVSTSSLLEVSLNEGKEVYLPHEKLVEGRPFIQPLLEAGQMKKGRLGIPIPIDSYGKPTPLLEYAAVLPKLVLLPGVGFDLQGGRIGYGGGFYDRLLAKKNAEAVFVALAYQCQISEEMFPLSQYDVTVDYIFTEERIVHCKK